MTATAASTSSPLPAVPRITTAPGGPELSRLVAGAWRMDAWQMDVSARLGWIEGCLERGVTTFDHADIYGHYGVEALFGEALAARPSLRERLQLVTKCGIRMVSPARAAHRLGHYDTSAAHVRASVEQSLRHLRTDHVDLLLIHRPDALMDADALAEVFTRLRAEGKVLHFGVSNHTPAQFELLNDRIPLATNQVELSPLHLDVLHDGTLDQAQRLRVAPMIWSPLAGGRLFTGTDEASQRVRGVMGRLAAERGVSVSTLAFAWLLRHPARCIPLTGSGRLAAIDEAVAAFGVELDAQAWYEIWVAGAGHPVP